jgi:uncharacterized protein (DUF2062 family)
MRQWIRRYTPSEETLRAHPSLRWMGPLLRRPWLWHLSRRRVALGIGIGVFFGFLIPVAQIFGAALFAVLLRANLPVAAVSTLVSNPFTYAPIFVLAYRTGASVLGEPVRAEEAEALAADAAPKAAAAGWGQRALAIGKPLMLGLAVFAVVGGVLAWALVHAAWTAGVLLKRRRRRRRPPYRAG